MIYKRQFCVQKVGWWFTTYARRLLRGVRAQYTKEKSSHERYVRVWWENYISFFFQIEKDTIVVTVFLSILIQMEFHLVQNQKENCHHDPIQFERKRKYSFLSVQLPSLHDADCSSDQLASRRDASFDGCTALMSDFFIWWIAPFRLAQTF